MAKQFNYFDEWQSVVLECPVCKWQGTFEQGSVEYYNELMDSSCPVCDVDTGPMLAIVSYTTNEEVEANLDKLDTVDRQRFLAMKERLAKADKECLKSSSDLPELEGDSLELAWDLEEVDSDVVTVIRHGDQEVWREPAFWEGYERFGDVLRILKARYGKRLKDVVPTQRSKLYLYGDRLSAPDIVDKARRQLQGFQGSEKHD